MSKVYLVVCVTLLIAGAGIFCISGTHSYITQANLTREIYNQCSGFTFHPGERCADGRCAPNGLATKVYAEWKRQFLSKQSMPEGMFAERIKIVNIELNEGPIRVFWRIEYVFVLDWVRAREADAVDLGEYPLDQEPAHDAISRAVSLEVPEQDQFTIPKVVSRAEAEKALRSCDAGVEADWCWLHFGRREGELFVSGRSTINDVRNQCRGASVNLATGKLAHCQDTPCRVS